MNRRQRIENRRRRNGQFRLPIQIKDLSGEKRNRPFRLGFVSFRLGFVWLRFVSLPPARPSDSLAAEDHPPRERIDCGGNGGGRIGGEHDRAGVGRGGVTSSPQARFTFRKRNRDLALPCDFGRSGDLPLSGRDRGFRVNQHSLDAGFSEHFECCRRCGAVGDENGDAGERADHQAAAQNEL